MTAAGDVVFVDFGHSMLDADKDELDEEEVQLEVLLL